jgi:hypothetical protein
MLQAAECHIPVIARKFSAHQPYAAGYLQHPTSKHILINHHGSPFLCVVLTAQARHYYLVI